MNRSQLAALLDQEDFEALHAAATERFSPVFRYLLGRLNSHHETEKVRAVQALGVLVEDRALFDEDRILELMRRFIWAMTDESGATPFGVPEAMGEVLARRPELQREYLPLLSSYLVAEPMRQTGPIERGVMWALGRVGPLVAEISPAAIEMLQDAARAHADPETRRTAAAAVESINR